MHDPNDKIIQVDLEGLYPELTEEERAEAARRLTRYVEVVRKIYERVNGLTGPD